MMERCRGIGLSRRSTPSSNTSERSSIGAPWLDDSACDHLLVSVPYPYGPDLEVCAWQRGHARLLWLLPITEAERDYRATNGLEALEARFDEHAIEFWDPRRPSVV